ncbi:MAG: poly(R)-hydroxyalkanoic acid synthase subunit PhaE [Actinomycetota bacterium]
MPTPTSPPLWRQFYNAWEQAVNPGLQQMTASNGFRDLLALSMKANADLTREIERASRQWLHLWNLPAASDVRRLRQQVSGLERQLVALRHELERQEAERTSTADPAGSAGPDAEPGIELTTLRSTNGAGSAAAESPSRASNGSRAQTTAA